MRIIDADTVIDRYYADWEYHCINMGEDDRQWLRQCIDKAPTIDAEPVVHGSWVWDMDNECWICANCKASALNNYRHISVNSNYCPNCGARMDGDA